NFHLTKKFFVEEVAGIGEGYGKNKKLSGKKVMVEYTDPNPFKAMHIGHLMSNAVGESIARLVEFEGAKVVRACWQGDVGLHVAKAIWGMKKKLEVLSSKLEGVDVKGWGEAYAFGSEKYESDENAKKEINALNKVIFEKSDSGVNTLYDAGRKVSMEHFEEIYKVLDTKFNHYFFEGTEGREGVPIVAEGLKKGVFEKSDLPASAGQAGGAIVYKGEKKGLHTRVFINSQGLPTYEAKELGLNQAKLRVEPDLDTSIIITANEQSDYFKVVLSAMSEVLPEVAKRTKHIAHGMLRFASGKMSSRTGNVVTGESLIEQVEELVQEKIKDRDMSEGEKKELAEVVAIGAIKYSVLRQAIGGDIIFDFEKSISFEGDSGPYLQYSYVRAKSVLGKATAEKVQADATIPSEWNTTTLEKLLVRFPEVVERAGTEYEPHFVTTYLTELAGVFNSWYAGGKIVDANDPTSPYKLALTKAFTEVMKNGLWLLGIKVPEKM
ncbi:MAG: arginine--tRNA ligase, partial [bacterium]|nr:arginine--tRNA ligase [bacterium]